MNFGSTKGAFKGVQNKLSKELDSKLSALRSDVESIVEDKVSEAMSNISVNADIGNVDINVKVDKAKISNNIEDQIKNSIPSTVQADVDVKPNIDMKGFQRQIQKETSKVSVEVTPEITLKTIKGVDLSEYINFNPKNLEKKIKDAYEIAKNSGSKKHSMDFIAAAMVGESQGIKLDMNTKDYLVDLQKFYGITGQFVDQINAEIAKIDFSLINTNVEKEINKTQKDLKGLDKLLDQFSKYAKSKDYKQVSSFWNNLEDDFSNGNKEAKELLKTIKLINDESSSIKVVDDGNVKSGGLIGSDRVLLATKNRKTDSGDRFSDTVNLKKKLDEAAESGINVARILDVIADSENKVFLEIQERAKGDLLGRYEDSWVNPDIFEATDEQVQKLFSDLVKLNKLGIGVDVNPTNILYDKDKGFSFIDLDLNPAKYESQKELLEDSLMGITGVIHDFYEDLGDTKNAKKVDVFESRLKNIINSFQDISKVKDNNGIKKINDALEENIETSKKMGKESSDAIAQIGEVAEKVQKPIKEVADVMDEVSKKSEDGLFHKATDLKDLKEIFHFLREINHDIAEWQNPKNHTSNGFVGNLKTKSSLEELQKYKQEILELNPILDGVAHYTERIGNKDFVKMFGSEFGMSIASVAKQAEDAKDLIDQYTELILLNQRLQTIKPQSSLAKRIQEEKEAILELNPVLRKYSSQVDFFETPRDLQKAWDNFNLDTSMRQLEDFTNQYNELNESLKKVEASSQECIDIHDKLFDLRFKASQQGYQWDNISEQFLYNKEYAEQASKKYDRYKIEPYTDKTGLKGARADNVSTNTFNYEKNIKYLIDWRKKVDNLLKSLTTSDLSKLSDNDITEYQDKLIALEKTYRNYELNSTFNNPLLEQQPLKQIDSLINSWFVLQEQMEKTSKISSEDQTVENLQEIGKQADKATDKVNELNESLSKAEKPSAIVHKATGKEISPEAYDILDRLHKGENVSTKELEKIPEVVDGLDDLSKVTREFINKYRALGIDAEQTSDLNSEERKALRDYIVSLRHASGSFSGLDENGKDVFNGEIKKQNKAVIVMGLPAAGKSTSLVNPLSQLLGAKVIDSDIIKELLPEYQNGRGSMLVHEESSDLNKRFLREITESAKITQQGENVIVPIVGDTVEKVEKYINQLKDAGYSVEVALNELPNNEASLRNLMRYFNVNRFIRPALVRDKGDKPSEAFENLKLNDKIDSYLKVSNNVPKGQRPVLIESKGVSQDVLDALAAKDAGKNKTTDISSIKEQAEQVSRLNELLEQRNKLLNSIDGSDKATSKVKADLEEIESQIKEIYKSWDQSNETPVSNDNQVEALKEEEIQAEKTAEAEEELGNKRKRRTLVSSSEEQQVEKLKEEEIQIEKVTEAEEELSTVRKKRTIASSNEDNTDVLKKEVEQTEKVNDAELKSSDSIISAHDKIQEEINETVKDLQKEKAELSTVTAMLNGDTGLSSKSAATKSLKHWNNELLSQESEGKISDRTVVTYMNVLQAAKDLGVAQSTLDRNFNSAAVGRYEQALENVKNSYEVLTKSTEFLEDKLSELKEKFDSLPEEINETQSEDTTSRRKRSIASVKEEAKATEELIETQKQLNEVKEIEPETTPSKSWKDVGSMQELHKVITEMDLANTKAKELIEIFAKVNVMDLNPSDNNEVMAYRDSTELLSKALQDLGYRFNENSKEWGKSITNSREFAASMKEAANRTEEVTDAQKHLNQEQPKQQVVNSGISENIAKERTEVQTDIEVETTILKGLNDVINDVAKAVDNKTDRFDNERKVAIEAIDAEITKLRELQQQLDVVGIGEKNIPKSDATTVNISGEIAPLTDLYNLLNNIIIAIREKTQAFEEEGLEVTASAKAENDALALLLETLKQIAEVAERVKLPAGEKLQWANDLKKLNADDIAKIGTNLTSMYQAISSLNVKDSNFINQINNILSKGKELENLTKVLSASKKDIAKTKEVTITNTEKAKRDNYAEELKIKKEILGLEHEINLAEAKGSKNATDIRIRNEERVAALREDLNKVYAQRGGSKLKDDGLAKANEKTLESIERKNQSIIDGERKIREEHEKTEAVIKSEQEANEKKAQAEKEAAEKAAQIEREASEQNEKATKAYRELTQKANSYFELLQRESNGIILPKETERLNEIRNGWIKAKEAKDEYSYNDKGNADSKNNYNLAKETFEESADNYSIQYARGMQNISKKLIDYANSGKFTNQLTQDLRELSARIDEVNKNPIDITNPNEIKETEQLKNEAEDLLKRVKSNEEKLASADTIAKLNLKIEEFMRKNSNMGRKFREEFSNLKLEWDKDNIPVERVKELTAQFVKLEAEVNAAGKTGLSFFDKIKSQIVNISARFIGYYFSFMDIIRYSRQAFESIRELDTALVDLKKTTTMSSQELEKFYFSSNDVAKQMGVTTKEIIDQAAQWSRLGYSSNEAATQMAKLSSQFASISPGMGTEEAQTGLVSIMKAWDIDVDRVSRDIMDNINTLGNKFALTNADIISGMERAGATLSAIGMDTKDSFALFTGAQEVIQNAETVGVSLVA